MRAPSAVPTSLPATTMIARNSRIDDFACETNRLERRLTLARVVHVAKGRERTSIRPFFEALGPGGCARIEAAVMDTFRT